MVLADLTRGILHDNVPDLATALAVTGNPQRQWRTLPGRSML
ncbi:MAG: hypothetical protein ABR926_19345 [Streptosporangiaceae bacterium]|jgi:hypothetical protein